ncbi:MAG: amidohydrolase [Anaerolineae bacterium]|nr:amidohydrolase [Anaerolineae bacterium]
MSQPETTTAPVTVFRHCHIHTLDSQLTRAGAMVVACGRVVWVGPEDDLGSGSWKEVDLDGAWVIPGLRDAHTHFLSHALLRQRVDLRDAGSEAVAVRQVAAYAARRPGTRWILGHGWNENTWTPPALPSRVSLDEAIPDRPVLLSRADGHMIWVNTIALRAAGIAADTPDPPGGRIERDARGEPTGILRERATALVWDQVPLASLSERVSALRQAQAEALSLGLVGLHTMEGPDALEALQDMRQKGELSLRVLVLPPADLRPELGRLGLKPSFGDEWLQLGQLKLFADGSLGSRTAWMLEPIEGEPDNRGIPIHPPAELAGIIEEAHAAGWPCAIHAIGDAANRTVLDVLERAPRAPGSLPDRIEHVQIIRPEDATRMGALGVVASMQPVHVSTDWRVADRLWGSRSRHSYAWRLLANAGVTLAFGSDAPVEPISPWAGLQVAITRTGLDGHPEGGWYPEQRLSLEEALAGFTRGVAAAAGEPHEGRLAPGCRADFVVLGTDPFTTEPDRLAQSRPVATYVGGRLAWS